MGLPGKEEVGRREVESQPDAEEAGQAGGKVTVTSHHGRMEIIERG